MTASSTPISWVSADVLLTGGGGFLGSWVARVLHGRGVLPDQIAIPRRSQVDLCDRNTCEAFVKSFLETSSNPVVLHCAGLSGGLAMHKTRASELYEVNRSLGHNLLDSLAKYASISKVPPVVVLVGHMTSYPADAPQPLREASLGTGPLDPTTERLGTAKLEVLAHAKQLHEAVGLRSVMVIPTNLYGEGDALDDPARSHAAGAMMHRLMQAVQNHEPAISHWGTGKAIRDFLHVEDAARGVVAAANFAGRPEAFNLGSGVETTLRELSDVIANAAGYSGQVSWDATKPDGVPKRVLSIEKTTGTIGWKPQVSLLQGVARTLAWYRSSRGWTM
ncbi:MAG: NAD-dependent epimerase/dehydratase family protein [Phycisphaerales bacterium]